MWQFISQRQREKQLYGDRWWQYGAEFKQGTEDQRNDRMELEGSQIRTCLWITWNDNGRKRWKDKETYERWNCEWCMPLGCWIESKISERCRHLRAHNT